MTKTVNKGTELGFQVIRKAMEKDRKVSYAECKALADKAGAVVYPIMYGRAQRLLGIVKGPRGKTQPRSKSASNGTRSESNGVASRSPRRASRTGNGDNPIDLVKGMARDLKSKTTKLARIAAILEE